MNFHNFRLSVKEDQGKTRTREKMCREVKPEEKQDKNKNNGNHFKTAYVVEGSVSNRKWSRLSTPALYLLPVTQQCSTNTMLGAFSCTV